MRRCAQSVALATALVLLVSATAGAEAVDRGRWQSNTGPDLSECDLCYIEDPDSSFLATTPSGGDRYVDKTVVLINMQGEPVQGFSADHFGFTPLPHSAYPELGGAPGGDCAGCEEHYMVFCLDPESDEQGRMRVRVEVGSPDCSPSMCCPVEVWVTLAEFCMLHQPIKVLQNSYDMIPSGFSGGKVDLSDIAAFGSAVLNYKFTGVLQPWADFVFSEQQNRWGELDLSDIAAFAMHIGDSCAPFDDPCN